MGKEKINLPELEDIRKELNSLNERLVKVESALGKINISKSVTHQREYQQADEDIDIKLPFQTEGSIEFRVGEYGMAWLGNIVLFFGLIFLVGFLQNTGNSIISALVGFGSVALIYACSYYFRHSLSVISTLLVFNGHFLLYFFLLRLHFFQQNPLLQNKTLAFLLLVITSATFLYIAFRKESQLLAGIALLMLVATGVFFDTVGIISGMASITAILTILLYYRFGWIKLTFIFIFIV